MELNGKNYLAPVEVSTRWDSIQTRNKSFLANEVQERMEEKGAAQRILILDACRDNPFDGRSLGRGGGAAMAPRGGLVAYAAGAGQVAADDGRYAARLVEALRVPGLSLDAVFTRVGEQIESSSGGRQTPARYSSGAVGGFVLNGSEPDDLRPDQNLLWRTGLDSGTVRGYENYLRWYPDGWYADDARARLAALRDPPRPGRPAPTRPDPAPSRRRAGEGVPRLQRVPGDGGDSGGRVLDGVAGDGSGPQ